MDCKCEVCSSNRVDYEEDTYEGVPRTTYSDGSFVVMNSIITNGKGKQLNGAHCALVAIYDALVDAGVCAVSNEPYKGGNMSEALKKAHSPWMMYWRLASCGWHFNGGQMLERSDLKNISSILHFRFEVVTKIEGQDLVSDFVGNADYPSVKLFFELDRAHYANGEERRKYINKN